MIASLLLASLCGSNLTPASPAPRPPVEVFTVRDDVLGVRSSYLITRVELDGLWERVDYFVEFSPDRRLAKIILRTDRRPLKAVIHTIVTSDAVETTRAFAVGHSRGDGPRLRPPAVQRVSFSPGR